MKRNIFILVLALQSAWILGTTFLQERALATGTVILLETRPVDPRDLLRGDYVILNYKISDVATNLFSPPLTRPLENGETVYVALARRGEFHEVVRASLEHFDAGKDEVVLKGQGHGWWNSAQQNAIHLQYGLEQYYVREGTGNPRGKLTVEAVVPASGRASIKQVFLDGQPYAEAMKGNSR